MSPDRHADRLHSRLAGGAELNADEQRHVATCAECQRVVADVGRLDELLRTATAGLASEPIPDADLETFDAPPARWTAPLSAVAAVGIVGIVIGFALGELRPPTGADATPTPAGVASATPTPSASDQTSTEPSPSPSTQPAPTPAPIPLASGGEPCADGEAGFSIVVPDGWYANLRQGDLMACAFIAQEPFDPVTAASDPDFDAPIRLTTSDDPTPPGTVIEHMMGDSSFDVWIVERDGEEWLVNSGPLQRPVSDPPWTYLHLGTRADDQAGMDALAAIRERLTISEPLASDPDAIAEADELFADADVCSDLERGVNVIMPDAWWTNTAFGDLAPCTYFAPDTFAIDESGEVPDGVAITLEVVSREVASTDEILGFETLIVDGQAARRWELTPELDTRTYQYVVDLGDAPSDGPSLVATVESQRADDYEREKALLDEIMRRLIISPTPDGILDAGPLPSCGWELTDHTPEGMLGDPQVRICMLEAVEAGEQAEMIRTGSTDEGAIVREIYRSLGPGEIELIVDWTRDPLGPHGWQLMRCTRLEQSDGGGVTGAVAFTAAGCDDPMPLEP